MIDLSIFNLIKWKFLITFTYDNYSYYEKGFNNNAFSSQDLAISFFISQNRSSYVNRILILFI